MKTKNNKQKMYIYLISIIIIVSLNILTQRISEGLKIPFSLDTWATSLGVMIGGLPIGIISGIAYNLVMSFTGIWSIKFIPFALCSIWIAIGTYFLYKKGWIDPGKPLKLIGAGIILGTVNAIIVIGIHIIYLGPVSTYNPTAPTYISLLNLTGSKLWATILEKIVTEISDKMISIFFAALLLEHIPKKIIKKYFRQE